jgi:hypothetical protein
LHGSRSAINERGIKSTIVRVEYYAAWLSL